MPNNYIIYRSNEDDRKITVINNQPYYCSTGKNSRNLGRWYPFLGIKGASISINNEAAKLKETTLDQFENAWMNKVGFVFKGSYIQGTPIPEHFDDNEKNRVFNKENLLNSIRLGGRDSINQEILDKYLQEKYISEDTLEKIEPIQLNDSADFISTDPYEMNNWLKNEGVSIPEEILGTYYYNSVTPEKPAEKFCSLIEIGAIFENEEVFARNQNKAITETTEARKNEREKEGKKISAINEKKWKYEAGCGQKSYYKKSKVIADIHYQHDFAIINTGKDVNEMYLLGLLHYNPGPYYSSSPINSLTEVAIGENYSISKYKYTCRKKEKNIYFLKNKYEKTPLKISDAMKILKENRIELSDSVYYYQSKEDLKKDLVQLDVATSAKHEEKKNVSSKKEAVLNTLQVPQVGLDTLMIEGKTPSKERFIGKVKTYSDKPGQIYIVFKSQEEMDKAIQSYKDLNITQVNGVIIESNVSASYFRCASKGLSVEVNKAALNVLKQEFKIYSEEEKNVNLLIDPGGFQQVENRQDINKPVKKELKENVNQEEEKREALKKQEEVIPRNKKESLDQLHDKNKYLDNYNKLNDILPIIKNKKIIQKTKQFLIEIKNLEDKEPLLKLTEALNHTYLLLQGKMTVNAYNQYVEKEIEKPSSSKGIKMLKVIMIALGVLVAAAGIALIATGAIYSGAGVAAVGGITGVSSLFKKNKTLLHETMNKISESHVDDEKLRPKIK